MAEPNLANISSLYGKVELVSGINNSVLTTELTTATDKLYHIKSIFICNRNASGVTYTIAIYDGSSVTAYLANSNALAANATESILFNNVSVNLPEGYELKFLTDTAHVDAIISYEIYDDA